MKNRLLLASFPSTYACKYAIIYSTFNISDRNSTKFEWLLPQDDKLSWVQFYLEFYAFARNYSENEFSFGTYANAPH